MPRDSRNRPAASLSAALRARRPELEEAILTRVYGIADPTAGVAEARYVDGLPSAVSAALDYGLGVIEPDNRPRPSVPPELLIQARLAARNGVTHDTVLRRYCAGNMLFADVLIEETDRAKLPRSELKRLFRALATRFDHLLASVSEEFVREELSTLQTSEQRRTNLVERLLAGELVGTAELNYDFTANHLGLVASGPGAAEALSRLSQGLDRRLLLVEPDEEIAWAWLGGQRCFDERELDFLTSVDWPEQVAVGCGEAAQGMVGWRLTHRQAAAAQPVAQRVVEKMVHYSDVALLASALQDDLLRTSLRHDYLGPLEADRDGGAAAIQTLRAYFAAAGNASSAAAALGVTRQTVGSRLAAIEERIGRSVDSVSAEIETALRLEEIEEA